MRRNRGDDDTPSQTSPDGCLPRVSQYHIFLLVPLLGTCDSDWSNGLFCNKVKAKMNVNGFLRAGGGTCDFKTMVLVTPRKTEETNFNFEGFSTKKTKEIYSGLWSRHLSCSELNPRERTNCCKGKIEPILPIGTSHAASSFRSPKSSGNKTWKAEI